MKIFATNSINNYSKSSMNLKSNKLKTDVHQSCYSKYSTVSFYGATTFTKTSPFRKPNLKNESLKKVFYFAKILPNSSSIRELKEVSINNEKFMYKVFKDSTGRVEVEMKNKVESLTDWNDKNKDKNRTILKCSFNPNGLLVGGSIVNTVDNDIIVNALFKHNGSDGRRLTINGHTYKPVNNDRTKWVIVSNDNSKLNGSLVDLASIYSKNSLMTALIELGLNRTSLQLLEL